MDSSAAGAGGTKSNDAGKSDGAVRDDAGDGSPAGTATGRFYVVGKDIIDPEGNGFFPFGANLAMSIKRASGALERPWTFDFGGTANGHSDDVLAWGWNAVRLNVVCYRSDNYTTPAELAQSVTEIAKEYTAKKIVVMPECHDDTGQTLALDTVEMKAADDFWDAVIQANKDNPYVWINPLNETTNSGTDASQIAYWTALFQHYIAKRNALGAENIIVVDIPNYAQAADTIANTALGTDLIKDQCNIALSWHAYGGSGPADTAQYETWLRGIQTKGIALLVGEYGYSVDGSTPYPVAYSNFVAAADQVLSLGKTYGMGALVWHGTMGGAGAFSLMSGYLDATTAGFFNGSKGQGLSDLGKKVWDAGHSKPSLARFTGSYAASHCHSAQ